MMPPIEADPILGLQSERARRQAWAGSWVSIRQARRLGRLALHKEGLSSWLISRNGRSKNTVMEIVKLEFRAANTYAPERLGSG